MESWIGSAGFSLLLGAALKSTCVLGTAWLFSSLLRRHSAALRHLVWTAAAAALMALPLLSISLPPLPISALISKTPPPAVVFRTNSAHASISSLPSAVAPSPATPQSTGMNWRVNLPTLLTLVWAAGCLLAMAHMLFAWVMMWRVRRSAKPISDPGFDALAIGMELYDVELLETPNGSMPMSFGVLRPAVFIPADAAEWTEDRRRVVMLHELAHVKRGDLGTHLLMRVALSMVWWNPLAFIAWREFVKERERAADDLVLTAGEPATEYASHLLEIARSMQALPTHAALSMAQPSQLEVRLLAILDSRTNRKSSGQRSIVAAVVLAVAMVAPFAALQAQDSLDPLVMPPLEETIKAAIAQQNHDILDAAAKAYAAARKYTEARQLLENSLAIRERKTGSRSPAYAAGLVQLGDLSARQGQAKQAQELFQRAVDIGDTPESAPALIRLAGMALARNERGEADSFIERAIRVAPAGTIAAQALMVKANIAAANQLDGVAELNYTQALAQVPADTTDTALVMEHYARFLGERNRVPEANTLKDRAIAIRQAHVAAISRTTPTRAADPAAESAQFRARPADSPASAYPPSAYRVGGGVSAPVLLYKREPEYSEEARQAKYSGTAVVRILISPEGQAYDFKLVKSLGFGLDEKAVEAVSQWKFTPGKKDGRAVTVEATVEVNFKLL